MAKSKAKGWLLGLAAGAAGLWFLFFRRSSAGGTSADAVAMAKERVFDTQRARVK